MNTGRRTSRSSLLHQPALPLRPQTILLRPRVAKAGLSTLQRPKHLATAILFPLSKGLVVPTGAWWRCGRQVRGACAFPLLPEISLPLRFCIAHDDAVCLTRTQTLARPSTWNGLVPSASTGAVEQCACVCEISKALASYTPATEAFLIPTCTVFLPFIPFPKSQARNLEIRGWSSTQLARPSINGREA